MPEYLTPGVYVEETSFRSKSIEGVPTSTFGMAGLTRYGPVPYVLPDRRRPMLDDAGAGHQLHRVRARLRRPVDVGAGRRQAPTTWRTRPGRSSPTAAGGSTSPGSSRATATRQRQRRIDAGRRDFAAPRRAGRTAAPVACRPGGPAGPGPRAARSAVAVAPQLQQRTDRRRHGQRPAMRAACAGVPASSRPSPSCPAARRRRRRPGRPGRQRPDRAPRRRPASSGYRRRPGGVDAGRPRDVGACHLDARRHRAPRRTGRSDTYTGLELRPATHPRVGAPRCCRPWTRPTTWLRSTCAWLDPAPPPPRRPGRPTAGQLAAALLSRGQPGYLTGGTDGDDGTAWRRTTCSARSRTTRRRVAAGDRPGGARPRSTTSRSSRCPTPRLRRRGRAEDRDRRPHRALRAAPLPDRRSSTRPQDSSISEVRAVPVAVRHQVRRALPPVDRDPRPDAAARPRRRAGHPELPPSGFVAGIYARSDIDRGVHKAPANEVVLGHHPVRDNVNYGRQEVLNPRASTRCASSRAAATGSGARGR